MSIVEGNLYYSVAMTTTPPLPASLDAESRARRAPQQERGQRRVDQILDAAELVFAEFGVAGTSMQLIADRAESSVGSLYHFFPNKDAIVDALGSRYAEAIRVTNEEAMPLESAHLPAEELFERILMSQVRFIEQTPAFDAVHQAVQRNCPAINDALNQALVGHVGKFLALRYPNAPELQRAASAMVSVTMVHGVVELASRLPSPHREAVLRESKAMLVAHFSAYDGKRQR